MGKRKDMIHPRFLGKCTLDYWHLIEQKRFIDWPILAYYILIGISAKNVLCFRPDIGVEPVLRLLFQMLVILKAF